MNKDPKCTICKKKFDEDQRIKQIICNNNHQACGKCAKLLSLAYETCPICNTPLGSSIHLDMRQSCDMTKAIRQGLKQQLLSDELNQQNSQQEQNLYQIQSRANLWRLKKPQQNYQQSSNKNLSQPYKPPPSLANNLPYQVRNQNPIGHNVQRNAMRNKRRRTCKFIVMVIIFLCIIAIILNVVIMG